MKRPSIARVWLSISLLLCWVSTLIMTFGMSSLNHRAGLARVLPLEWLLSTPVWTLYSAIYLLCLGAFLFRFREERAGWLLMGGMAVNVGLEMSLEKVLMPQLEVMLAGGLLGSWLIARLWAARTGLDEHQKNELGHEAMVGTFAAMLVLAAASKLHLSGISWLNGATHCAVMFEHDLLSPSVVWSPIRQMLSHELWACSLGAGGALGIELLGVLMLWPAMRKWYAMAVVALFGSLIIMYGIFELSWPAMACALAWSSMGSQTSQK